MGRVAVLLVVAVALVVAASAGARVGLHGATKIAVVDDGYLNLQLSAPTGWQVLHCIGGYRSTARSSVLRQKFV